MTRRRFAFWLGMFLFWLSEKLRADVMDSMAASLMVLTDSKRPASDRRERWSPNENRQWRWYERHTRVDGEWTLSGVTTPVHKVTGAHYSGKRGYLDEKLVPEPVRRRGLLLRQKLSLAKVDPSRQAVGGKPPSKWLRSLDAEEIRIWLRTVDVPEVGVEGMTFWTHLTRDHAFSSDRIDGLNVPELAKLHSAAHYGY